MCVWLYPVYGFVCACIHHVMTTLIFSHSHYGDKVLVPTWCTILRLTVLVRGCG